MLIHKANEPPHLVKMHRGWGEVGWGAHLPFKNITLCSVDQAGSERTEAGESAPSRLEDSPRPGRAKCKLCETLQDLIMGAGEEASLNLPCLLILASS